MKSDRALQKPVFWVILTGVVLAVNLAFGQAQGPVRITLDEAVQMALQHNHNQLAMITTIQQAQAEEITANLRPNPSLFADWEYLPLSHSGQNSQYLHDSTEGDLGLSYLFERGRKRQHDRRPRANRERRLRDQGRRGAERQTRH